MHEEKGHPPATPAQAPSDPIESMMSAGELPAKGRAAPRDLKAEALAAARGDQTPSPSPRPEPAVAVAPTATGRQTAAIRREWMLRGLLAVNLALVGAVLALPIGRQPVSEPTAPHSSNPSNTDPAASSPPRSLGFAIGEQSLYLRSLELASAGKFDDAIGVLEGHLQSNPFMGEVEQRLVYHALAMFAVRAGRNEDASRYEAAMDRLRIGAQLPQDLLNLARQAEAEGRGADMRRYYARFLLQQKQVPPSLRDRIAEAYLKLGDGYRVEAESGAKREAASKRAADAPPDTRSAPGTKSGTDPTSGGERKERGGHE